MKPVRTPLALAAVALIAACGGGSLDLATRDEPQAAKPSPNSNLNFKPSAALHHYE